MAEERLVSESDHPWLALMVGNSRLHWAWFVGGKLKQTWDTPHLSEEAIAQWTHTKFDWGLLSAHWPCVDWPCLDWPASDFPPLWLASVVPQQISVWQAYPQTHLITLEQVPLQATYPTLGIDRAIALSGLTQTYQSAGLVIDAGTALTLTAADAQHQLLGGAILPGIRTQLRSLAYQTAALPLIDSQSAFSLPPRWSKNTEDAICSGVIYSILSGLRDFVEDWQQQFPQGAIALTGGDSQLIYNGLQKQFPDLARAIILDPDLIFKGIQTIWASQQPVP